MANNFLIEVVLEDGPNGYLRVHSEQLPGLILSGIRADVIGCIMPAIKKLLELRGFEGVSITQTMPFSMVLSQPSPRIVEVDVAHEDDCDRDERQFYLVELSAAA